MNDWKKQRDKVGRNEWVRDNYSIVEMKRPIDEVEYFIYHKGNYLTTRLTPECAREYAEARLGIL